MSRQRHDQALEIFLNATDLDESSRASFLDDACGGDQQLRSEVESLLRHHTTKTLLATQKLERDRPARAKVRRIAIAQTRRNLGRNKFGLVIAGIMLLALLGTEKWVYDKIQESLRKSVVDRLETVRDAGVQALRDWIEIQQDYVVSWTKDDEVHQLILAIIEDAETSTEDSDQGDKLMGRLDPVRARSDYNGIAVTNRRGYVVASSDPVLIGALANELGAPYIDRLNDDKAIFAIPSRERRFVVGVASTVTDPAVAVGAPILNDQNVVRGALCFGFDADEQFTRLLSTATLGATGESYAFDRNGVLLSNVRYPERLVEVELIESHEHCVLNLDIVDPGGDLQAGFRPTKSRDEMPPTRMIRETKLQSMVTNVEGYRNYQGVKVVGVSTWLEEYGLGIATEMEYEEAYEPLSYVTTAFLFLTCAVTLLAIATLLGSISLIRLKRRVGEAEQLGEYELQRLIGRGGMGRVFLAKHAFLKRDAAIKLLDGVQVDNETIGRFEREVQLTCQLTHPNTIQIYDYGRTKDDILYYAMEYLPGTTLESLRAQCGIVPAARVIHILNQVCASLSEAHRRGMIHRDVKPANVMVCERGGIFDFVKVLDFGIAKQVGPDVEQDITRHNSIVGTPHYIAPERISSSRVDARSDLYSVGSLGFYLLTGQHPFSVASPVDLFRRIVSEQPPLPSSRTDNWIPDPLDELIRSCLSLDPADRPQSADQMVAELSELSKICVWTQNDARLCWERQQSSPMETEA